MRLHTSLPTVPTRRPPCRIDFLLLVAAKSASHILKLQQESFDSAMRHSLGWLRGVMEKQELTDASRFAEIAKRGKGDSRGRPRLVRRMHRKSALFAIGIKKA
jgi:hypothetical protein